MLTRGGSGNVTGKWGSGHGKSARRNDEGHHQVSVNAGTAMQCGDHSGTMLVVSLALPVATAPCL